LGIGDEEAYEAFADSFLGQPRRAGLLEFTRPWNGDLVRYDEVADVFAMLGKDRFIKTCYRPDPSIHGEATNLEYFFSEDVAR